MKKVSSLTLVLILAITALSSCSDNEAISPAPPSSEETKQPDNVSPSDTAASPSDVTSPENQEDAEDASSFEYVYSSELGGVVIMRYIGANPSVRIPSTIDDSPVVKIGDEAFSYLDFIGIVLIPDSVTTVGIGAFQGCERLRGVSVPSVTSIGDGAFAYCESLTSIKIPPGVTSIEESAFYACESLKHVIIPDSVASIGDGAFARCEVLSEETIARIQQINPEALF